MLKKCNFLFVLLAQAAVIILLGMRLEAQPLQPEQADGPAQAAAKPVSEVVSEKESEQGEADDQSVGSSVNPPTEATSGSEEKADSSIPATSGPANDPASKLSTNSAPKFDDTQDSVAARTKCFILDGASYNIPYVSVPVEANGVRDGEDAAESERLFLLVDSKAAQDLIRQSGRRFSWSTSGSTLMVFANNGEFTHALGASDIVCSDHSSVPAQGVRLEHGGHHLMEPALFVQLLDFAVDDSGTDSLPLVLLHKVYAPALRHDAEGTKLVTYLSSLPAWSHEELKENSLKLQFKNAVWASSSDKLHLGHVNIKAEERVVDGAHLLSLTYEFPPYWSPVVRSSFDPKLVQIACVHNSKPLRDGHEAAFLKSSELIKPQRNGAEAAGEALSLQATAPFRYFWHYCSDCHKLCLCLDNVNMSQGLVFPEGGTTFAKIESRETGSSSHPILSLEFTLDSARTFEQAVKTQSFSIAPGSEEASLLVAFGLEGGPEEIIEPQDGEDEDSTEDSANAEYSRIAEKSETVEDSRSIPGTEESKDRRNLEDVDAAQVPQALDDAADSLERRAADEPQAAAEPAAPPQAAARKPAGKKPVAASSRGAVKPKAPKALGQAGGQKSSPKKDAVQKKDKAKTVASNLFGQGQTLGFAEQRGIIVLDPGHGGGDPGCYGRYCGIYEKEITLDVALRLRDILEEDGWKVLMTRENDRDVSWRGSPDTVELQYRCDVANSGNADYFISLHCNASVASWANGSSVYWYKSEDRPLAEALKFSLNDLGFYQIGTLREGFYVLRNTDMPSVLVEMAYLTNRADGNKLADPACRQRIAEELAEAINQFANSR